MFPHNIPRTSAFTQHLLFVLVSSFQRTVSSHFIPKHHVPRIPAFISLHFRATFLPFLHLRPPPQHQTEPTITEISLSPFPNNPPKFTVISPSLPPNQQKPQKYPPPFPPPKKKPWKYAYFRDLFSAAVLEDPFDDRSDVAYVGGACKERNVHIYIYIYLYLCT